jgi:hypothetical protein
MKVQLKTTSFWMKNTSVKSTTYRGMGRITPQK